MSLVAQSPRFQGGCQGLWEEMSGPYSIGQSHPHSWCGGFPSENPEKS